MDKRVLITGGTGFIGTVLCRDLISKGYSLTVLSRQGADTVRALCGRVEVTADLKNLEGHPGFHAVINLAGEGIADKRWTEARKQALRDSRIGVTRRLVATIKSWQNLPEVLVSGSAVGFYGDQRDHLVTEDTQPNAEFTHELCHDWEQEALVLEQDGVRVCLSRTGVVAGRAGGFLQRMILPFRLGLGGRLGSGHQFMPWVHRNDVVAGLIWMLEYDRAHGAYNMVSPNPATNREFTRTLGKVLHRPTLFPAPAPILKLALGEMATLLLTGQKAVPMRLQNEGFEFKFPELRAALEESVTG
ncbi:TIGR01777 family oxidoreductase [Marinobacter halophilus]|uniref:TIGR01777 family protein n=1 Tax=Marinobacter halophilus TaxID=1323740 RepID=A0A2T1KI64_9GAMM|nr:TIGR01777 family oxidoreductase [Marinobacter halophilus]PSF09413.1 TIGR01777 family protein [Marinobacter halophilus]GGC78093.1 epimerase [Marinobacter halophilus]